MAALVLMDFTAFDEACMRRALELARDAALRDEVPVGAVIVDRATETIVAEGANAPIAHCDPTLHAEIAALRAAGQARANYRLNDLSLYVTLEPCAMCAAAISHARIKDVSFGAADPKGGAILHGPKLYEQPTIHWRPDVRNGLLANEAAALLREFFQKRRKT
jgi:tRNA(adenine34) deaminase